MTHRTCPEVWLQSTRGVPAAARVAVGRGAPALWALWAGRAGRALQGARVLSLLRATLLAVLAGVATQAQAQASAPGAAVAPWSAADHSAWADMAAADAAHGRRLHTELRCAECHTRRVGGDGSAIYRPAGRIQRPAALLSMVEMCNTELKLQLFPEDVAALAAALHQDHYRLRPPAR